MKTVFQLQPMVLAVSGALALMASAVAAQTFDPNSVAVRQAYVGVATQEKKDAALTGLGLLVNQVRQSVPPSSQSGTLTISGNRFNVGGGTFSGGASVNISTGSGFFGNGSASGYIVIAGDVNNAFNLKFFSPTPLPLANIQASNDSDLGAPGTAVPLNGNTLQTLASFNTARNFTIDTLGGTIDTQGFDFGISGRIDANGKLTKLGSGTLTLTGNNVWNANIVNLRGVIEGNTNSLQTSIVNNGTVRFNQSQDGIYSGIISSGDRGYFEKTGAGKLTLTATQTYYNGITTILGGTLALSDSGALPLVYSPALHISSGATFDISGSSVKSHFLGAISGGGNIILGANSLSTGSQLSTNAFSDTTFSGSISGLGSFTKAGGGTLTLTGVNSYSGNTNIFDSKLSLSGEGRLNSASVVQMTRGTFDISSANGRREAGSLGGSGNANLGANTLTVGNASSDDRFEGSISGSGGLTKTGTGTLTLIGANTYSGITTINQGTLAAHAQSISNRVVNNGTLNFVSLSTDGFSLAYGGAISGTGSVNKSFGTLTLTGVNSYTGTTTVNDGWLALAGQGRLNAASSLVVANGTFDISGADGNRELGSVSGSGNLLLGNNTLTVGSTNTDQQFSGQIQGSGGFTKTGTGSLTLTGVSNFTGVTTINQGNLIASTYNISERVVNTATLTLSERMDTTRPFVSPYSGAISGSGQLIKEGDGIIWLRGRNTYTGGTTVNSGWLIGNTDSLQGSITNDAALVFYQVDNGTYTGTLNGKGSLLQYGPGALTLTGSNAYTGGTAFAGTLRVIRDENLGAASGSLVMAGGTLQIGADIVTGRNIGLGSAGGTLDTNGHQLTISGSISGPGGLTKVGAGTLSLSGGSIINGVTVSAGRFENNNIVISDVTTAVGAEYGGTGLTIGNVVNGGRLSRGSAIGDILVLGTARFEPGSVFAVKANAAGNSDRLYLGEFTPPPGGVAPPQTATLNGGSVDVRAENGNYRRETRYNIIVAAGGVTGQFGSVTSNLAFLNPTLSYDPNNVYLTLKRNDLNYAAVAQNPNQSAVAQSLTRMTTVTTGDASTITAALDGLSAPQARAAFNSIGAAGRATLPQVGTFNQRSVNQNLVARLGIAEGGNTLAPATGLAGRAVQIAFDERIRSDAPPIYAQAMVPGSGQGLRAGATSDNNGLWLRGYGGAGRLDGDANSPGAKYNFGGTLFGYDRKISDGAIVGVFGGYAEPRYNQDLAASSAHTKTYQLGGYGRLNSGAWHIDGAASYARNSTDTSRVVTVGALNRVAAGSFNGDAVSVHVETGYTIKASGFEVQPLAALSWVRQTQNAYSETGAGALNLVLPDQHQQSLRSTLGVRGLVPFQAGTTHAVFEARAAWAHEFNNTRSISARLAGDPAASVFTVSGPSLPRDTAVVGVGIAAQASRNLRLYADVNGEFNGRERAATVSVGLRYQW